MHKFRASTVRSHLNDKLFSQSFDCVSKSCKVFELNFSMHQNSLCIRHLKHVISGRPNVKVDDDHLHPL